MEFALIHNNQLLLGPIGFNVRMINSELEELDLEDRISPQSYTQVPIHFSDQLTHLVLIEKEYPEYNPKYQNVGDFIWEIIKVENIPEKVKLTYIINNKTLDEVKNNFKEQLPSLRREKENKIISLSIKNSEVEISTSREERILLSTKLASLPGVHNYKFKNTWMQIDENDLHYIVSEVDKIVQQAFDWELLKIQEIDSCTSIDQIYNIVLDEQVIRRKNESNN